MTPKPNTCFSPSLKPTSLYTFANPLRAPWLTYALKHSTDPVHTPFQTPWSSHLHLFHTPIGFTYLSAYITIQLTPFLTHDTHNNTMP